jgi:hypothetical protein
MDLLSILLCVLCKFITRLVSIYLFLTDVGSNFARYYGIFDVQVVYRTSVVLLRFPLVHGEGAPEGYQHH